jgi:hypothetical protein
MRWFLEQPSEQLIRMLFSLVLLAERGCLYLVSIFHDSEHQLGRQPTNFCIDYAKVFPPEVACPSFFVARSHRRRSAQSSENPSDLASFSGALRLSSTILLNRSTAAFTLRGDPASSTSRGGGRSSNMSSTQAARERITYKCSHQSSSAHPSHAHWWRPCTVDRRARAYGLLLRGR